MPPGHLLNRQSNITPLKCVSVFKSQSKCKPQEMLVLHLLSSTVSAHVFTISFFQHQEQYFRIESQKVGEQRCSGGLPHTEYSINCGNYISV